MFICPICELETQHYGHGICKSCYMIDYRIRGGVEYRAKRAVAERARRERLADDYRARDRERNARRRDQRIAYNHQYYQRNKETSKEQHRLWRKANPGLRDLRKRRYKSRKAALETTLTRTEWEAIKDGFNHCCVYCNRSMHNLSQEHVIPVVQGGGYTRFNIVPACRSCNTRKHTSTGFEYLIRIATEKQTGVRIPGPSRNR